MRKGKMRLLSFLAAAVLALTGTASGLMTSAASVRGDADGSGSINMKDITQLQRYINDHSLTIDEYAADADGSGSIDMKDITLLQRYVNGWNVEFGQNAPKPTIVGYTYLVTNVDEVTETKIKTIKLWIDSKGMSGGYWANVNNNGGYADLRHPMFFAYTQVYCTGWDYFAKELNEEIGRNFSASELKKAYQNGEMELWIDLPNVNTSETNAKDWYVNRMISTYDWWCDIWKQTRTINEEFKTYLLTPKSGRTWEQSAFEKWRSAHEGGYVTGNVQIGVWKRPVTKVITPASKSISRTGIIYSDGTVKSITPVKTDYATESTFLAQQGIAFPSSDPAWIEYLN